MKSSLCQRRIPKIKFLTLAWALVHTLAAFAAGTEVTSAAPAASAVGDSRHASYGEVIAARIKSHIRVDSMPADNVAAEVFVNVESDGTVLSAKLVRSSGNPDWDAAVVRAVEATEKLPLDEHGHIPRSFSLVFWPRDSPNPAALSMTLDGRSFIASQSEIAAYQSAVKSLRAGRFDVAATLFRDFISQFPSSGYMPRARYWLGNAQFAQRQFEAAQESFRSLLSSLPIDHPLRSEVLLSIANSQLELGSRDEAKQTLQHLVDGYPQSAAARLAQERLHTLQ